MKYILTLSRWHKVAERINTALKEREANVKTAFTATTYTELAPYPGFGLPSQCSGPHRRMVAERTGGSLVTS